MRILFVDIDTLRPDHMGCYGYIRNTTPNIDCLAAQALRLNGCYCADAPCLPSRAGLVTGRFGIHTGVVGHGGTAADRWNEGPCRGFTNSVDDHNLHHLFRRAGMRTASISTFPERHAAWWFNAGLHETYNVGGRGEEEGGQVLPVALDWLERNGKEDGWYLHVHLWDPHTPYRTPGRCGNPFAGEPLPQWLTEDVLERHRQMVGPHGILEMNMYDDRESAAYPRQPGRAGDMDGLRRVIDGYDCGVWYADALVGEIFDKLRALGVYEDTAVIVTSDHGENLGELGIYSEHATADYATCHIPFIIKWPGGVQGAQDSALHYNLDLAPTMAELLGLEGSERWDGQSYADTVLGNGIGGRDYLILSQMAHVCQRSVRFGRWLYMRTYHDGYHLSFRREMLFDLLGDPHEQHDLSQQYPELCARGARLLMDWHDSMMLSSDSMVDPLWTVLREGGPYHTIGGLERYLPHLEKTGREEGARVLRDKYGHNETHHTAND